MKVRDIMSTSIITEDEDTPVIDIARDMKELGIGSVVITSEDNPAGIGIITERDIALKVLLKDRRASEVKAKEIMSSPLITIEPDIPVEKACELIAEKRIKRLPVIENGILIGITSVRNILSQIPGCVQRFYPEVRVLASGWTLDRLERALSEAEKFLMVNDADSYKERIKEVYEELRELIGFYRDDKELREVYGRFEGLYNRMEEPSGEQRKRLETVLRKLRHITYWRKRQSISSFASGVFWFHDYRHGVGKKLRLPFKRTRP